MLKPVCLQNEDKEFWLSWLNSYRDLKCLWEENAKREAGASKRHAAYKELANLIIEKGIKVKTDITAIRRRINAFRTGYRRELRKVQVAKENGSSYEPQLFYYKTLDFLNDSPDIFEAEGLSNNDSEDDINLNLDKIERQDQRDIFENVAHKIDSISNVDLDYNSIERTTGGSFKTQLTTSSASLGLQSKQNCKKKACDEYDILGKRIAAHFRNMSPNQRLIAEKIISDVCIYGRMQKLTLDSSFIIDPAVTFICDT